MGLLDWTLSVGAVVLMFVQGWWVARAQKTNEDYFVGGRRMHWLAVGLAMFATTFSPLSFVGQPREAAFVDYHLYLAILFIPLFAVPIVGWLFVPIYHRLQLTSAYEYLELRFDWRVRRCGSFLFGLYMLSWMGTMLHATMLVVQAAVGFSDRARILTMIVLAGVTAVYTTMGGYKATVWTNVIKSVVLAGVVVLLLLLAVSRVDGGWASVWRLGHEHNKFAMFKMEFDVTKKATFFAACAFGMFVYLSVSVSSQAAIQRYASMPTVGAARRMLAVNGVGTAVVCLLFFLLGSTMFAFYTQHPAGPNIFPLWEPKQQDKLTMHFIARELPYPGLVGLVLAALFTTAMGSISSGLNALSALIVCDWRPGRQLGVAASRVMTAVFGLLTVVVALVVPVFGDQVFEIIMRLSGALFGPLLGLFLLAAGVRRANAPGALIGLAAGIVVLAFVFPSQVSFWWYGAFTCAPIVVVGTLASYFFPAPEAKQILGLVIGEHVGDESHSN